MRTHVISILGEILNELRSLAADARTLKLFILRRI